MKIEGIGGFGLLMLLVGLVSVANAGSKCGYGFMKDPCSHDRYSVVETEPFVKVPHNCMANAHYFPGEEPLGYCRGKHRGRGKGKNSIPASSRVRPILGS